MAAFLYMALAWHPSIDALHVLSLLRQSASAASFSTASITLSSQGNDAAENAFS